MLKRAVLAAVFAGLASTTAFAWSEVSVSLADPTGKSAEGKVQTGVMEGYFCSDRTDAETLAKYLRREQRVQKEDLAIALGHCNPDVRPVAGAFPEDGKYPVVFVRMLDDLTKSSYLVQGLLSDMKLQEARAQ